MRRGLETIDFNKNLRVYTIVFHRLKNLTQDFGKMELKLFEAINFFLIYDKDRLSHEHDIVKI